MSTQTPSLAPDHSSPPPYEGFDWGGLVQICQALRDPEVRERLFVGPLSFDELAWAPRRNGRPLGASDVEGLRERLQYYFARHGHRRWRASMAEVARAVAIVARENPTHPVRTRLAALAWDGEVRLGRVAAEVLGVDVKRSPHTASLVRKWFLTAVGRVFEPGRPVEPVLTLLSPAPTAGLFFRLLVGEGEHADLSAPLDGKRPPRQFRECWLWQRDDLPVLAEKDPALVAAVLAQSDDPAPTLFGANDERAPRTTLFVAHVESLPDVSEAALRRRFWLVPCGALDTAKLTAWADQLWAEAVAAYLAGAEGKLTPEESEAVVRDHPLLADRDPWEAPLLDYLAERARTTRWPSMAELLAGALRMKAPDITRREEKRAGAILRKAGYVSAQRRFFGVRRTVWVPESKAAEWAAKNEEKKGDRGDKEDTPPDPFVSSGNGEVARRLSP